jgi:hypothetical protein
MGKLIRKTYQASETKAVDDSRSLIVTISTVNPDRSGDVVIPGGVKLENYLKNPVVAFAHRYNELALAKAENIMVNADSIQAKVTFPKAGVSPLSDQVYELYKGGFMNAWSIGFIPGKWADLQNGGRQFSEWELLEFSAVLVPDNPEALTIMRSKGIDTAPIEKAMEEDAEEETKGVIQFKETPPAPEGQTWDGPAQMAAADIPTLKIIAAWFDSENPDVKSSYKLPHHLAEGDNKVVWKGVAAAMGALLGSRGGVSIPDADRKGVYNHLSKHYAQFDKTPPEFKEYTDEELKQLFPEEIAEPEPVKSVAYDNGAIKLTLADDSVLEFKTVEDFKHEAKEGRVLSQKNRELIKSSIDGMEATVKVLKDLYDATDASGDDGGKAIGQDTIVFLKQVQTSLRRQDQTTGQILRTIRGYLKAPGGT